MHSLFSEVDVETSDLGTLDPRLHRFGDQLLLFPCSLTLTRDCAVQGIARHHETLPHTLSMSLQHVDRLDWVLLLPSSIDSLDGQHGVNGNGCKEIVITGCVSRSSARTRSDSRRDDFRRHGRLCHVDERLSAEFVNLCR